MNTESNIRVNLRMQSMAWSDFQLLSHPSPLPLFSQSDKHHKKTYVFTFIAKDTF